jgi:hypothetical protein
MTKQDALATGELEREPLTAVGDCEFYSARGGQEPDPAWTASDQAYTRAHHAAVTRANDLAAKVGPQPAPDAPEPDQIAWVLRSADAGRAVSDVAVAASAVTERADHLAGPTSPAGMVSFHDGRLRQIGAPKAARTADDIGVGSTVDDLRKTYLGRGLTQTFPGRYEMPARGRAGWVLDFDYLGTQVVFLQLRDTTAKCA